jgi:hypothetical protein
MDGEEAEDAGVIKRRENGDFRMRSAAASAAELMDFTASSRPLLASKSPLTTPKEPRAT